MLGNLSILKYDRRTRYVSVFSSSVQLSSSLTFLYIFIICLITNDHAPPGYLIECQPCTQSSFHLYVALSSYTFVIFVDKLSFHISIKHTIHVHVYS